MAEGHNISESQENLHSWSRGLMSHKSLKPQGQMITVDDDYDYNDEDEAIVWITSDTSTRHSQTHNY